LDSAGNRTAKTDDYASVTSDYSYDSIYELTQVTQGGSTTESYSYDAVGNRTASLGVSSYTNNSSNELTATSSTSYAYDYNGNTTGKTDSTGTTSYTWDYENRLVSVTLPSSGGTTTFKYDAFGRRIQKAFTTGSTTTTDYVYDGENDIEELNASGTILARYTQTENIDEPLAESRSSTTSFYEADGLGSVTSLTNSSGTIANSYTYDSFGKLTASTGSVTNPFQYTGRDFDPETGLHYYRARYYDPSTAGFLSEDPVGFRSGVDFYRYVLNNPVLLDDSLGLSPSGGSNCGDCPADPPGILPITGGVVASGLAERGLGTLGSSGATASVGLVASLEGPVSVYASGGAFTSKGNVTKGKPDPASDGIPWGTVVGHYTGAGLGLTFSNGKPCQLGGIFHTINGDFGLLGFNAGISLGFTDSGVWQFSFQLPGLLPSAGVGAGLGFMNTNGAVHSF